MTEKAQQIINRMRERDRRRRVLALMCNPQHRTSTMGIIHMMDQDEPARVGRDQEIKVLNEMNELQDFEDQNRSRGEYMMLDQ